jgi:hypothetical protein
MVLATATYDGSLQAFLLPGMLLLQSAGPSRSSLEAVREGSNTGEPPQHQTAHHRIDRGLAPLTQPVVVLTDPLALRQPAKGSFRRISLHHHNRARRRCW